MSFVILLIFVVGGIFAYKMIKKSEENMRMQKLQQRADSEIERAKEIIDNGGSYEEFRFSELEKYNADLPFDCNAVNRIIFEQLNKGYLVVQKIEYDEVTFTITTTETPKETWELTIFARQRNAREYLKWCSDIRERVNNTFLRMGNKELAGVYRIFLTYPECRIVARDSHTLKAMHAVIDGSGTIGTSPLGTEWGWVGLIKEVYPKMVEVSIHGNKHQDLTEMERIFKGY